MKFWLHVLLPLPHLKQAASPLNNHTVLEYGTLAKSRFVVAQPVRGLLRKQGIFGPKQEKKTVNTFTAFLFTWGIQIKTL